MQVPVLIRFRNIHCQKAPIACIPSARADISGEQWGDGCSPTEIMNVSPWRIVSFRSICVTLWVQWLCPSSTYQVRVREILTVLSTRTSLGRLTLYFPLPLTFFQPGNDNQTAILVQISNGAPLCLVLSCCSRITPARVSAQPFRYYDSCCSPREHAALFSALGLILCPLTPRPRQV